MSLMETGDDGGILLAVARVKGVLGLEKEIAIIQFHKTEENNVQEQPRRKSPAIQKPLVVSYNYLRPMCYVTSHYQLYYYASIFINMYLIYYKNNLFLKHNTQRLITNAVEQLHVLVMKKLVAQKFSGMVKNVRMRLETSLLL